MLDSGKNIKFVENYVKMSNSEQQIFEFKMLVKKLLDEYTRIGKELASVKAMLAKQQQETKDMESLANAAMHDYDMLKQARMLEIGDGDLDAARKRINKLIRDVNKCITLITELDGE